MITEDYTIYHSREGNSAIEMARFLYAQYKGIDFDNDMEEYMNNGVVFCRPDLFTMVREVNIGGELCWFCRIAVGELPKLLDFLLLSMPRNDIKYIAFCRRNDGRVRKYPISRLIAHALKLKGRD